MEQKGESCWVTYISPMRLVEREGEKITISLYEINNCTYDQALLCRIVGSLHLIYKNTDIKLDVCGDGALAIKCDSAAFTSNDLLLLYNDFLCKLLIGGIYVEAVNMRNLTTGSLHENNMLWPVNFGESLSSNMHARVRMKLANNMESIFLDGACSNSKSIKELASAFIVGGKTLEPISNLSTYYLISGITEMMHKSWSSSVSNLWIVIEQLTDFLWIHFFLTDSAKDPGIPARIKSLQQDNRTFCAAVKQEILYQVGIISKETYSCIYSVRKARNKLVHEGTLITEDDAVRVYNAVNSLLQISIKSAKFEELPKLQSHTNQI